MSSSGSGGRTPPSTSTAAGRSGFPVRTGEALYSLLVESVGDYAIFALDTTGHVLTWNRGAERIKGYTADEIIGKSFEIFYPEEDVAARKTERVLETARRDGRFEEEGWRVRKGGGRFWASVIITALRSEDGRLVGFAKVTRDLTERRRAEEALRQSEERFRLLVQSVRDYAIFILDPDGRIATWNDGAERIKGYRAADAIGRHFSLFYPPEDIAAGKPAMELEVAAREGQYEDEGWRVRKDGARFWANTILTALRDPNGRLLGFAKVTRDLTERRAAQERELSDATRLAAADAANRAKSDFLATLSHELRTPLNAIGGYVELMMVGVAGAVSDEQREYLARIQTAQRLLLGIINDLLNYSRIEAGHVSYDLRPLPLGPLVERALAMVTPQAVEKRIEIVPPAPGADIVARADEQKVEQAVLNLLSNAVKFTPPGGRITASCERHEGRPTIRVSDTGPGIPRDKWEAIFEPFVQLGRSLATPQHGAGLGLAISRDLTRAMGGDIVVESVAGEGSTFTMTLQPA